MGANNLINYVFLNNLLLVGYRLSQKNTLLKKLGIPIALLIVSFLAYDLFQSISRPNYFTQLGLSRSFSDETSKTAIRNSLKKYHPDKRTGDAELYLAAQEIGEILQSKQAENLMRIYSDFGEDPRAIFFDKFASKNYPTYQLEAVHDLQSNFYIFIIFELIALEELNTSSTITYSMIGVITLGYLFEATLYGYSFLQSYRQPLLEFMAKIPIFDTVPNFVAITFVKKLCTVIATLILIVAAILKRNKTSLKFDQIWEVISSELISKRKSPNQNDLLEKFDKKLNHRISEKKKEQKFMTYIIVFFCVYWAMNYFNLIHKLIRFIITMKNGSTIDDGL